MADLSQLQGSLGIHFKDEGLLRLALTHSSYLNENLLTPADSNERLEFLGDAFLGYAIAQQLYTAHPNLTEGQLTEARAWLVRSESLAEIAQRLRLGDYLYLGRGEEQGGGRERASNLAACFEAVVAAVLLDQGPETARRFIKAQLGDMLAQVSEEGPAKDPKSQLQELVQARWKVQPSYVVSEEAGENGETVFVSEARINERVVGWGRGSSKQRSQKQAAQDALERLAGSPEIPG